METSDWPSSPRVPSQFSSVVETTRLMGCDAGLDVSSYWMRVVGSMQLGWLVGGVTLVSRPKPS